MPTINLIQLNNSLINSSSTAITTAPIVNFLEKFLKQDTNTVYFKLSLIALIILFISLVLCLILNYEKNQSETKNIPFENLQPTTCSSITLSDTNSCNCNNVTHYIKSFSNDRSKELM